MKDSNETIGELHDANSIFTTPLQRIPPAVSASLHFTDGRAAVTLEQSVFLIGRADDICDLSFADDEEVSRLHAAILYIDDRFFLEDLGSANGTYSGGDRVWRVPLRPNSPFKIGKATLIFHCTLAR